MRGLTRVREAPNFATGPVIGCNPDFNQASIGTRTIWNPVPNLDIGLEVVYTRLETKHDPNTVLLNFPGAGGWQQSWGLVPSRPIALQAR